MNIYSEDYIESLVKNDKSKKKQIEDVEPKVKSKRRVYIHEYTYSDGTTSIVINNNEEYEGLDHNDIIQIVREELRKRKNGRD